MPIILFVLAQAAPVPTFQFPPAPPPLIIDAPALADRLRRECLSEKAVALAVDDALRRQALQPARIARSRAVERELGEASFADPLDIDRLERAKMARDADQDDWIALRTRDDIALIRRLPPADRAIYARRLTIMQPVVPPRTCAPKAR